MKNRKRDKAVLMLFTAKEKALFDAEYAKTRFHSRADFILALLADKPVVVVESLTPLLAELKRQGNNINQIAREINGKAAPSEERLEQLIRRWIELYDALVTLAEGAEIDAAV